MSAIHSFEAKSVRISEEDMKVYVVTPEGYNYLFPFSFSCKAPGIRVMFDMAKNSMMAITPSGLKDSPAYKCKYLCIVLKFWVENDLPVPSARYWTDKDYLANQIGKQFKDKLASYMLDRIINS